MIVVQYGWLISSGTDNWELDDNFFKNSFAADDIFIWSRRYINYVGQSSSSVDDYHPYWLIIVPNG
jgi:hypothetical protein